MSAVARLRRLLLEPEPPAAAIEVRAGGLAALRLQRDGRSQVLGAAAALRLPEGALRLSLQDANLADSEAFGSALAGLCERVGLGPGSRVALVLPDPVARVAFVPAAEVKARSAAETLEQLRFRLKKTLPFDVREARLAWCAVPAFPGQPAQLMVAALFAPVLADYEAAACGVGLVPGVVEVAGLALLRAVPAGGGGDELVVNWDRGYVSLALLRAGEPTLYRTLTGELAAKPEEVAREAQSTVLYYAERLGGPGLSRASLRSGLLPFGDAARLLDEAIGLWPEPLDPWAALGGGPPGVETQTFEAAAASLLAGAA